MIVRVEILRDNQYLVVDEISRVLGTVFQEDFEKCLEERDSFEEDEYTWWYVNKECLELKLKK
jgi:AAA+ ATPase superfamily predicted ATPase